MNDRDISIDIASRVEQAHAAATPLAIHAGGTRAFYGNTVAGQALDVTGHRGIIDYQPTELVLTARCGTPLSEIESVLRAEGQMLAFEPPVFGPGSTLGGAIATGLSGPRRPFAGAVRDFVLGVRMVNGRGDILKFGGQVMKNVAGYDISRLMAGAQGMLGVLLDISVKVLPIPEHEVSLTLACDEGQARARIRDWTGRGFPVTASAWRNGQLQLRLGNTRSSVEAARAHIGGDHADPDTWAAWRHQQAALFAQHNLWRLSVPPATADLGLDLQGVEWAGAQRWVRSSESLFDLAASLGGHAIRYDRDPTLEDRFQPLPPGLLALHQRLRAAFDPGGILNPGRLYRALP